MVTSFNDSLLTAALKDPTRLVGLSQGEWDLLILQARRSRLAAKIAFAIDDLGDTVTLPSRAELIFESARNIAGYHARMIRWEVNRILHALADVDTPVLLLKGAAYALAGLPVARGRLVSDVDIMVPKTALKAIESAVLKRGWAHVKLKPYDQRYYRRWMHELPPLQHRSRGTALDIHHTILPLTSRLNPDPEALWTAAVTLENSRLQVLAPTDMVLHSAAHLFQDGDLYLAIRDLSDIDSLLRHFGSDSQFWSRLVERARLLDLERPLYYALRYSQGLLGTPIPSDCMAASEDFGPNKIMVALMDNLVPRALIPGDFDVGRPLDNRGGSLLFIRSHWLRMPPLLLFSHLTRKALMRTSQRYEAQP